MKLFQITHKYAPYLEYFEKKYSIVNAEIPFNEIINLLIEDGFMYSHLLKPIVTNNKNSFYTIWNYERLQLQWAKENNIVSNDLKYILSKQLEVFKPDVIYNMSTQLLDSSFFDIYNAKKICWNADPNNIDKIDFSKYDALLTSAKIVTDNLRNAYLHYPSDIKKIKNNTTTKNKPIDLFFYGQFTSNVFKKRNNTIEKLMSFGIENNIIMHFHLMYQQRFIPLINRRFFRKIKFFGKEHPPRIIRENAKPPIFGNDITLNNMKSKIVFNMSAENKEFGNYKFNMRIFETLGSGAFMLSDEGIYPENIIDGKDFVSYKDFDDLEKKILYYLKHDDEREAIAYNGKKTIEKHYSKDKQWDNFTRIIQNL